jgi:hypothetical protein
VGRVWHSADLGHTSQAVLSNGVGDFAKMQTAFGLVRMLGGSKAQAWSVQGSLALIAVIAALWRSRAEYELKAAALGVGDLLVTPLTTSWCWRCRSPSSGGSGGRADFCPMR